MAALVEKLVVVDIKSYQYVVKRVGGVGGSSLFGAQSPVTFATYSLARDDLGLGKDFSIDILGLS